MEANNVLEIIHSDIFGPIKPVSNGGKRYFVTFTDDFSRKTWVYFLHEICQSFKAFNNFKVHVENETGRKIKTLKMDRCGEYCSNVFDDFCKSDGIRKELTKTNTTQQNSVSER